MSFKKNVLRSYLLLILILTMVLTFTACTKSETTPTNPDVMVTPIESVESTDAPETLSQTEEEVDVENTTPQVKEDEKETEEVSAEIEVKEETKKETTPLSTAPATKPSSGNTTSTTPSVKPTEATTTPTIHTHSHNKKVTAATCTDDGYTTYTCTCGDSYTGDKVPAKGHNYLSSVTDPTCTEKGFTLHSCSSCGHKYTDNEVDAAGHTWADWEITKAATTDAEGEQKRTCKACGSAETQKIDKVVAEAIDLGALASYGRSYGANAYGFEANSGCFAGYYPAYTCYFDTMAKGKSEVAACVDATAAALLASGPVWGENDDGTIWRAYINVKVEDLGNNQYWVWVYYG